MCGILTNISKLTDRAKYAVACLNRQNLFSSAFRVIALRPSTRTLSTQLGRQSSVSGFPYTLKYWAVYCGLGVDCMVENADKAEYWFTLPWHNKQAYHIWVYSVRTVMNYFSEEFLFVNCFFFFSLL